MLINLKQAAELLGVRSTLVKALAETGKIPFVSSNKGIKRNTFQFDDTTLRKWRKEEANRTLLNQNGFVLPSDCMWRQDAMSEFHISSNTLKEKIKEVGRAQLGAGSSAVYYLRKDVEDYVAQRDATKSKTTAKKAVKTTPSKAHVLSPSLEQSLEKISKTLEQMVVLQQQLLNIWVK